MELHDLKFKIFEKEKNHAIFLDDSLLLFI